MAADQSAPFESVSRGVTADRLRAAILTARFRPEQLLFKLLGVIERQMARSPAVVNRLAYKSRSKMSRVRIPNGACSRRHWHAFDLLYLSRLEVGIVNRQALRHGTPDAESGRQRHMHLGRTRVGQ